jgi:hypothetical protein
MDTFIFIFGLSDLSPSYSFVCTYLKLGFFNSLLVEAYCIYILMGSRDYCSQCLFSFVICFVFVFVHVLDCVCFNYIKWFIFYLAKMNVTYFCLTLLQSNLLYLLSCSSRGFMSLVYLQHN